MASALAAEVRVEEERAARPDGGRLTRSAMGHVGRNLEAKAQINRARSHPGHSRSPVMGALPVHTASMSSGSRRCNHAARRCASLAGLCRKWHSLAVRKLVEL